MHFVPAPGRGDDVLQLRVFRLPAQVTGGARGGGDQGWWIARSAGSFEPRDGPAGDLFAGPDDLPHGVALAVAQVVNSLPARFHRQDMRTGQVHDVDVIADRWDDDTGKIA